MKRDLWRFLIKLAFLLVALGFLWFWKLQDAYPHLLAPVAIPFLQWVGVKKWLLSWLMDHFTNIVPYVALVLATPGAFINWKKTTVALLGGLVILITFHLILSWLIYYFSAQYGFTRPFFRVTFPFRLLNDALPLALWLLFYPRVLPELFSFIKFGRKYKTEKV